MEPTIIVNECAAVLHINPIKNRIKGGIRDDIDTRNYPH